MSMWKDCLRKAENIGRLIGQNKLLQCVLKIECMYIKIGMGKNSGIKCELSVKCYMVPLYSHVSSFM